ncbi:hypothetical protein ACF0H5_010086 [Mactra antiquata]
MGDDDTGKLELLFAHLSLNNITSIKPILLEALDEYYTLRTRLTYNQRQELNFIKRLLYHVEREEWIQARENLNDAQKAYKTYLEQKMKADGYSRRIGYSQIHGKNGTYRDDSDIPMIEWHTSEPSRPSDYMINYKDTDGKDIQVENQYHTWKGSSLSKQPLLPRQPLLSHRIPVGIEEQGPEVKNSSSRSFRYHTEDYPGTYSKEMNTLLSRSRNNAIELENLKPELSTKEIKSFASKDIKRELEYDPNKPYYIAEAYHNLFEHEWQTAMTSLQRQNIPEDVAIECMIHILHEAYLLCEEEARSQIVQLEHAALNIVSDGKYTRYDKDIFGQTGNTKHISQYRKEVSDLAVKRLQDTYLLRVLPSVQRKYNIKGCEPVDDFCGQCVAVTWRMVIQEPPYYLDFLDLRNDHYFDPKIHKLFGHSGPIIECVVWPTLRLYKDGMVLCRGIVQCK